MSTELISINNYQGVDYFQSDDSQNSPQIIIILIFCKLGNGAKRLVVIQLPGTRNRTEKSGILAN